MLLLVSRIQCLRYAYLIPIVACWVLLPSLVYWVIAAAIYVGLLLLIVVISSHTQVFSLSFTWGRSLEIMLIVFLRWNSCCIRSKRFIFIGCRVLSSDVFVHSTDSLVVTAIQPGLLFNLVVFDGSYHCVVILIINHHSPRRLRRCSFVTGKFLLLDVVVILVNRGFFVF